MGSVDSVCCYAIPTRILEEVKYQGIGVDYVSQKYFVKTNAGAFEIANIRKVEYITDRENRAIEGFLIYGGISLVAGGILWLIADPGANTADGGPALAGFYYYCFSDCWCLWSNGELECTGKKRF